MNVGNNNDKIISEQLVWKGNLLYEAGEAEPYTGKGITICEDCEETGHIREDTHFKNGIKDGKQIVYYCYGDDKKKEGYWKEGKRTGKWTCWHTNKEKKGEDYWKDGQPHGKSIRWDEDGRKWAELDWENGKLINIRIEKWIRDEVKRLTKIGIENASLETDIDQ